MAILAGWIAVACSMEGDSQSSSWVGDTLVVENIKPVIPDTLVPREVLRVGRVNGPPEYLFSDIVSFTAGPDGSVFVHDRDDGIRRFAPDGNFVEYVARPGQGPTEVRYVLGMDVGHSGELAAVDLGNARVALFDLESGEVTTLSRPNLRPRYVDGSILFMGDGTLWMGVYPHAPSRGGLEHPYAAYLQVSPEDGTYPDTIFTPRRAGEECTELSTAEFRAGYWADSRTPFVPKAMWALGRDGSFALGCPKSYSLDVHRPDGTVTRIHRNWSPVVMGDNELEHMKGQAGTGQIPRERPAYARIVLPGDGRAWVWPNQPGEFVDLPEDVVERFGEPSIYRISAEGAFDVFDRDGRWIATVQLPSEARFSGYPTEGGVVIRGDTMWALAEDELGVQSIVRYEVPALSSAGEGEQIPN